MSNETKEIGDMWWEDEQPNGRFATLCIRDVDGEIYRFQDAWPMSINMSISPQDEFKCTVTLSN